TDMTDLPPRPQLRYLPTPAPPGPRIPREWLRRGLVVAALFVAVFSAWAFGPSLWRAAQARYWQRKCLNYTAPADQVVYADDPAEAAALLKNDPAGYNALDRTWLGMDPAAA